MAQQQLDKIFLGHTPIKQRNYLTAILLFLKNNGYEKVIIPACGQFTLVQCALSVGFKAENIYTSDISLYSSLLGYLFSKKNIDKLNFTLNSKYINSYNKLDNDLDRVAYIFWVMKLSQLSKVHYRPELYANLNSKKSEHIKQLKTQIKALYDSFEGINYDISDLRSDIMAERDKKTVVIVNPPVFKKGYEKMFDFDGYLEYESGIEEFDWKAEYKILYENSKQIACPIIWYRYRDVKNFNKKEVIFAKEYKVGKQDYWLITKPEVLDGFKDIKNISSFSKKILKPYNRPIFNEKDIITKDSIVQFVNVPVDVCLYYRDLFAHKLGNTGAEHYYLMLVDNKVFSTVGFSTSKLFRLQQEMIFENFGFSISSKKYPRSNKLLMMMITSKEIIKVIHDEMSSKNRIYKVKGLKTTCLSKYRTIKTHKGILKRTFRELQPNGLYRIQAETDFHDRDFKETLLLFLKENDYE